VEDPGVDQAVGICSFQACFEVHGLTDPRERCKTQDAIGSYRQDTRPQARANEREGSWSVERTKCTFSPAWEP
jgi:hypothetical protein